MNWRWCLTLAATAGLLAACSSDSSSPAPTTSSPAPTTQSAAATTQSAAATTQSGATPTSTAVTATTQRGVTPGGYSVTPIRSDGQRVTFRLTVPDGAVAEVSLSPPDATIMLIEPSVSLLKPDGQPGGGGGIFPATAGSGLFASICAGILGGNCTPKTTTPLTDGNRVEEFARTDGGVLTRVVFGPWAMIVGNRESAAAFDFHGGPDGFPVVAARAAGYAIKDPYLTIYMTDARRYIMRSDPAAVCSGISGSRCDRGLSIEPLGTVDDVVVRRVN